jgi:dolichol-phosphate mannosyltransferase
LNQHLRHEQGARRVRSTFPQAVVEHPSWPATVPHEGPAGRRGGARGSTARVRKQRERLATLARFAAVGATGIVVNQLILWAWVAGAEHHYLLGAVVATQGSSTWNFCLTERWVFPGGGSRSLGSRYFMFLGINNSTLLLRIPVLALLTSFLGVNYLVSNFLTLVVLFLLRFLVSDRVIWKPAGPAPVPSVADRPAAVPAHRSPPAPPRYLYRVGGFVSVGSDIQLRELQYFQVPDLDARPDIRIRVQPVGERGLRARSVVTHGPGFVTYEEHLGQLGGNFRLDFGRDRIDVAVAPLLGRSPHVVYTNVVEALLRFVLVSRGCLLLHSATVELEGHGVMLTARTDTGKTSTILRLLREQGGGFLADDMTIVEPGGRAYCYPKPLTISAHTVQAIAQHTLTRSEQLKLAVQSRLHSKGGRRVGSRLGELNLPIMALNATTQALVPPPKYMAHRLVRTRYLASTRVRELFVIARGAAELEELDHETAVDLMIENTDDAYGFPPFRSFAPAISIDGDDYGRLRERERDLLTSFLAGVRVRRLTRDDFSWADEIPTLLNGHPRPAPDLGVAPLELSAREVPALEPLAERPPSRPA